MKKIYLVMDRSGYFDDDMYEGTEPEPKVVMAFEHIADAKSWIESEGKWDIRFHGWPQHLVREFLECGESPKWHHVDGTNSDWYGGYCFEYRSENNEVGHILDYSIQEIELY